VLSISIRERKAYAWLAAWGALSSRASEALPALESASGGVHFTTVVLSGVSIVNIYRGLAYVGAAG
jgi:hypothetical protein